MPAFVLTALIAAAAFVVWSSGTLPDQIASHFGASGQADGFMARTAFVAVMVAAAAIFPGAIWLLLRWMARLKKYNIPHREYWFSAQHCESTTRFLDYHAAWFTVGLAAFMCVVHWLVVQANIASGVVAQLDNQTFLIALALFLAFTITWVVVLYRRFRKPG